MTELEPCLAEGNLVVSSKFNLFGVKEDAPFSTIFCFLVFVLFLPFFRCTISHRRAV